MKFFSCLAVLMLLTLSAWPVSARISPSELNPLYVYVGSVEDGGWNKALERGRLLTDQKFPGVQSRVLQNLPEGPEFMIQVEKIIKSCNNRLVIASSYGYGEFISIMARKHPQVSFVHISGYNSAPNLAPAFAQMYQMRYLTGIIAGLTTQSNSIGYVAGYPIAEVIRGLNAFTLGVQKVNPQATVRVVWLNAWIDIAKEEDYACQLIDQGCDVLAMHTDTTAVAQACERRGVAFIGYSSDMREFAPSQFLVAPVWNWDVVFSRYYQQVIDGEFDSQYYCPDLASKAVGLTEYGPRVSEAARNMVDQEREKLLVNNSIFVGPIKDSQGELRLQAGERITQEQLQTMDWLVRGVEQVSLGRSAGQGSVYVTGR